MRAALLLTLGVLFPCVYALADDSDINQNDGSNSVTVTGLTANDGAITEATITYTISSQDENVFKIDILSVSPDNIAGLMNGDSYNINIFYNGGHSDDGKSFIINKVEGQETFKFYLHYTGGATFSPEINLVANSTEPGEVGGDKDAEIKIEFGDVKPTTEDGETVTSLSFNYTTSWVKDNEERDVLKIDLTDLTPDNIKDFSIQIFCPDVHVGNFTKTEEGYTFTIPYTTATSFYFFIAYTVGSEGYNAKSEPIDFPDNEPIFEGYANPYLTSVTLSNEGLGLQYAVNYNEDKSLSITFVSAPTALAKDGSDFDQIHLYDVKIVDKYGKEKNIAVKEREHFFKDTDPKYRYDTETKFAPGDVITWTWALIVGGGRCESNAGKYVVPENTNSEVVYAICLDDPTIYEDSFSIPYNIVNITNNKPEPENLTYDIWFSLSGIPDGEHFKTDSGIFEGVIPSTVNGLFNFYPKGNVKDETRSYRVINSDRVLQIHAGQGHAGQNPNPPTVADPVTSIKGLSFTRSSATTGTLEYEVTLKTNELDGIDHFHVYAVTLGEKVLGSIDIPVDGLDLTQITEGAEYTFKGAFELADLNNNAKTDTWVKVYAVVLNDNGEEKALSNPYEDGLDYVTTKAEVSAAMIRNTATFTPSTGKLYDYTSGTLTLNYNFDYNPETTTVLGLKFAAVSNGNTMTDEEKALEENKWYDQGGGRDNAPIVGQITISEEELKTGENLSVSFPIEKINMGAQLWLKAAVLLLNGKQLDFSDTYDITLPTAQKPVVASPLTAPNITATSSDFVRATPTSGSLPFTVHLNTNNLENIDHFVVYAVTEGELMRSEYTEFKVKDIELIKTDTPVSIDGHTEYVYIFNGTLDLFDLTSNGLTSIYLKVYPVTTEDTGSQKLKEEFSPIGNVSTTPRITNEIRPNSFTFVPDGTYLNYNGGTVSFHYNLDYDPETVTILGLRFAILTENNTYTEEDNPLYWYDYSPMAIVGEVVVDKDKVKAGNNITLAIPVSHINKGALLRIVGTVLLLEDQRKDFNYQDYNLSGIQNNDDTSFTLQYEGENEFKEGRHIRSFEPTVNNTEVDMRVDFTVSSSQNISENDKITIYVIRANTSVEEGNILGSLDVTLTSNEVVQPEEAGLALQDDDFAANFRANYMLSKLVSLSGLTPTLSSHYRAQTTDVQVRFEVNGAIYQPSNNMTFTIDPTTERINPANYIDQESCDVEDEYKFNDMLISHNYIVSWPDKFVEPYNEEFFSENNYHNRVDKNHKDFAADTRYDDAGYAPEIKKERDEKIELFKQDPYVDIWQTNSLGYVTGDDFEKDAQRDGNDITMRWENRHAFNPYAEWYAYQFENGRVRFVFILHDDSNIEGDKPFDSMPSISQVGSNEEIHLTTTKVTKDVDVNYISYEAALEYLNNKQSGSRVIRKAKYDNSSVQTEPLEGVATEYQFETLEPIYNVNASNPQFSFNFQFNNGGSTISTPSTIEDLKEVTTGVEDVIAEGMENAEAEVEYYNLQGIRVQNPANGIYIRVQGNQVSKVRLYGR